jgi:hypothetical protein
LGPPFIKQKALFIDQGFSYTRNLSLIWLKWSKVTIQDQTLIFLVRGLDKEMKVRRKEIS